MLRAVGRMTARPRARLVILDPDHWDAFEWLACAVRARGLEVVHLVPDPDLVSRGGRVVDRIMFGRTARLPEGSTRTQWLAAPTVDVQGPDDLVDEWRSDGIWPGSAPARRVPDEARARLLHDKRAMDRFAEGLGITVPRRWDSPPRGEFPIVVKRVSGAGGQHVRVAADPAALIRAVGEIDPGGRGDVFYQEHVLGHCETFGGVADAGRILVGATYRTMASPRDPLGPAEAVQLTDSHAIRDQVEVLCAALEYTGFLCVDFMVRPDGTAALIDVNPRVFGSWLTMQQSGVDVLGAYLSLFGLGPGAAPVVPVDLGRTRLVRHTPRGNVSDWREWARDARESARSVLDASAFLGWRYVMVGTMRTTARLAASAGALLARRD